MRYSTVDAASLQRVYDSDQAMYPVPLAFSRLQSWVEASPDLNLAFHAGGARDDPIGVIITLPLRRPSWEALLCGKLREVDIEAGSSFPPLRPDASVAEVGLHVFHVERFGAFPTAEHGPFTSYAMRVVEEAAEQRGWRVIGASALTASPEGRRSFSRMGFKPTGYKEVFVQHTGWDEAAESTGTEMVCVYPGEAAGDVEGRDVKVVNASEMMVRFQDGHKLGPDTAT